MEVGEHKVKVLSHSFDEKESGAAGVAIKCQFDNGETDYGRIWMVKKTGEMVDKNVDLVRRIFGWVTDDIADLNAATYEDLYLMVTVEMDTTQNGRSVPRIAWFNVPKKVMTAEAVKDQSNRFRKMFASSAKTVSVKPLTVPASAPAAQQEKKADPGAKTLEEFNKVFSDKTQEHRTALWHALLQNVLPNVDTSSATREQWVTVCKAIPALRKQVEEQDKATEEMPF
jgi:hypothetical protein